MPASVKEVELCMSRLALVMLVVSPPLMVALLPPFTFIVTLLSVCTRVKALMVVLAFVVVVTLPSPCVFKLSVPKVVALLSNVSV